MALENIYILDSTYFFLENPNQFLLSHDPVTSFDHYQTIMIPPPFGFCNKQESQHRTTVALVLHRGKKVQNTDSVKLSVNFGFEERIALVKLCGASPPCQAYIERDPFAFDHVQPESSWHNYEMPPLKLDFYSKWEPGSKQPCTGFLDFKDINSGY